jgi:general nucleoside transport system ATP-binding protein
VECDHTGIPALVQEGLITDPGRGGEATAGRTSPHLAFRSVTKRYGSLVANDRVELEIARGSIHAIVGENGAGKSTLMGIAFGLVTPDAGTIEIDGTPVRFHGPRDALARGIGMVQQRFQLLEELSALENLVLGVEPSRGVVFDRSTALARAEELASALQIALPWTAPVRRLSVEQRQRLEILRLLYRRVDLLILDEPTSVLAPREVDDLFVVLRRLRAQQRTIVFISHKLREVEAIADRVTVMRAGAIVATLDGGSIDLGHVAKLMVGDARFASIAIEAAPETDQGADGQSPVTPASMLRLDGVRVSAAGGIRGLDVVDLELRAGEIVGVAGVEGSGQRQLVDVVVGLRRCETGRVLIAGCDATSLGVAGRRRLGLAFISGDRDAEGVNLAGSVRDSAISLRYRRPPLSRLLFLRPGRVRHFVTGLITRFAIRAPRQEMLVRELSGGNVQRLVVGRELERSPRLLVAAYVTRGVDIRGSAFVYEQLRALRSTGSAILLISEELDELLALSDRLVVLFGGEVVGQLARHEFDDRTRIGRLMVAGRED